VQVDTLDVRPLPGVVFKQFTARDAVSRWDVIQAHTRATAATAGQFLETLLHRMPAQATVWCLSMAEKARQESEGLRKPTIRATDEILCSRREQ
jgi:hypothetical protein